MTALAWGPVDSYRDRRWYPAVPIGIPERFGVPQHVLDCWRANGWLGLRAKGSGHHYPWHNPDIVAQVDWLRRLAQTGRTLDDEDAAAGFRLRAFHAHHPQARYAVRVAGHRWMPIANPAALTGLPDAYTLAQVTR